MSGVAVSVAEVQRRPAITDQKGRFELEDLPAGSYTVVLSLGELSDSEEGVLVASGATTGLDMVVEWRLSVGEQLTVFAASRALERIVEAPAAVSILTADQIEREPSSGQLPKLLEFLNGVEVTQSGLYDFKFNVRGANTSVNRRVAVLIDGRDPSFPLLGSQEWAAVSFPLDDLAGAELIRGPSSALYGANAFNGLLNLTTKAPRYSQGGFVRLTGGELSTGKLDLRAAGRAAEGLYYKFVGGYTESDDFYRSRNETVEYSRPCTLEITTDCLLLEAVPLPLDRDKIGFASGRLDRYFGEGRLTLVAEAGTAQVEGYVLAAPGARFQITELSRPWARVNLNAPGWNLLATYSGRDAEAVNLAAGEEAFLDSYRATVEFQGHSEFSAGRGRFVAGGWAARERVDSAGPDGVQTLLPSVEGDELWAIFGQLEYDLNSRLRLVGAVRFDDSTLYDTQFSPRLSLVWAPRPDQTLRLGYNEGFLRPNYPEYFVRVPVGQPVPLMPFEGFCAPAGVSCGFDEPVPLLVVGNQDLRVESIRSIEAGYNLIVARRGFLTVDVYRSVIEDFVQQFVPQLGTRLGRANPHFGPYAPPPELPPLLAGALVGSLQVALGDLYPFLSTEDGAPLFALRTAINFGRVVSQGADVSLDYPLGDRWSAIGSYGWVDFNVKDELEEAPLLPNGPEHKISLGVTYIGKRLAGSLRYRWFDDFRWAEGILIGDVPSSSVVSLSGVYNLSESWELGLNASNLLNSEHRELFSGDILGRRALAHVTYSWN